LRLRAFATSSAVGFVVGFAMFGSITYLPLYLQVVQGASPTNSGLRLIAMMAGLLLTSTLSGQIISRWGRYKVFPVVGCAIFSIGLFLLSSMNTQTSALTLEVYMFVLGAGLGMVMQVLVIVVQNAVQYRDLGAATSGVTFFRSIGSSFGVAIFGAIFSNDLAANAHLDRVHAYAAALQPVFLAAGCIGAVAFFLAWLIPEVPLRETTRVPDTGEVYAIPSDRTSAQELERALSVLADREGRLQSYRRLADLAGVDLDPAACWMLIRVGQSSPTSATKLAEWLATSVTRLQPTLDELESKAYIGKNGETLSLLEPGVVAYRRLVDAREKGLDTLLRGWPPEQQLEMASTVRSLAERMLSDDFADALLDSQTRLRATANTT
jgi:MFS family permease